MLKRRAQALHPMGRTGGEEGQARHGCRPTLRSRHPLIRGHGSSQPRPESVMSIRHTMPPSNLADRARALALVAAFPSKFSV